MSKITIDRSLLEQALEVLKDNREDVSRGETSRYMLQHYDPVITALRGALAQPQPEPAWWPAVENILNEYGLQAIDFVADFKSALAQPQQEPVGVLQEEAFGRGQIMWIQKPPDNSLLYTSPPAQRKPLTDEQLSAI